MPLELHRPPLLVAVAREGAAFPALLLASRGDRRYVQLSRGPGSNHLVWVNADDLRPATVANPTAPTADAGAHAGAHAEGRGLPWARPRTPV